MAVRKKRAKKKATPKKRAPAKRVATQRARKAGKLTKRERVAHIFQLMCSNGWVTGLTYRELAEEWGIAEATVRSDSAEASRQVKELTPDKEALAAQLCTGLQSLVKEAAGKGETRNAIEGIKTLADISGVSAPKKLEVKNDIASLLAEANSDIEPEVWEPPKDSAEPTDSSS